MKQTTQRTYALSRNELIAAVVAYVGLPKGTVPESFSLEAAALAEPAPVAWLNVTEEVTDAT